MGRGKGLGASDTRVWGVEIDYIAKGFNSFKKKKKKSPPDTLDPHGSRMLRGKGGGVRIFLKGTDLFPASPPCSPICHTYPAF